MQVVQLVLVLVRASASAGEMIVLVQLVQLVLASFLQLGVFDVILIQSLCWPADACRVCLCICICVLRRRVWCCLSLSSLMCGGQVGGGIMRTLGDVATALCQH